MCFGGKKSLKSRLCCRQVRPWTETCLASLNLNNTGVTITTVQGFGFLGNTAAMGSNLNANNCRGTNPGKGTDPPQASAFSLVNWRISNYFMAEWQVSGSHCTAWTPMPRAPAPPHPVLRASGPPPSGLPPYAMLPSVTVLPVSSIHWHIDSPHPDCLALWKIHTLERSIFRYAEGLHIGKKRSTSIRNRDTERLWG